MPKPHKATPSIRDLYPTLTEEELREAEENFDAYLEVILRIYERIAADPEAYEALRHLLNHRDTSNQEESQPSDD